jgi:hypothetical protein
LELQGARKLHKAIAYSTGKSPLEKNNGVYGESVMKTYVVHVYRRHPDDAESITGILEDIENEEKVLFHTFNEFKSLMEHSIWERTA